MEKLNILVVGSGGREHALVWKLAQSPRTARLYCVPGNAGISRLAQCFPIKADDIPGIVAFAKEKEIGLVVVGPEAPLTMGLVDLLAEAGIRAFGPSAKAAEIEGSKAFAKNLMQKYGIPTARYGVFSEVEKARSFAREMKGPWVIKADGLAAGKGVVICSTLQEAEKTIEEVLVGSVMGRAGERIIIEEFLEGEEVSILAFCDGTRALPMVPAQDHKRIFDGDKGPNTGGMGAYSPVPVATPEFLRQVQEQVLEPIIKAMAAEGRPYRGVLYPGLILTGEGIKVLEFNARFGDPETQVILPRLESDLLEIMLAAAAGNLEGVRVTWQNQACITVVMASGGYPGAYQTGYPISGLEQQAQGVTIFHSGTAFLEGQVVTAGGRVLSVTALGNDLPQALERAYHTITGISFKDCQFRRDIAHRALGK